MYVLSSVKECDCVFNLQVTENQFVINLNDCICDYSNYGCTVAKAQMPEYYDLICRGCRYNGICRLHYLYGDSCQELGFIFGVSLNAHVQYIYVTNGNTCSVEQREYAEMNEIGYNLIFLNKEELRSFGIRWSDVPIFTGSFNTEQVFSDFSFDKISKDSEFEVRKLFALGGDRLILRVCLPKGVYYMFFTYALNMLGHKAVVGHMTEEVRE